MAKTVKFLGKCDCPVCKMSGASVRETVKGKAYILCDECMCQIFARGIKADQVMRGNITEHAPVEAPKIAPPTGPVVKAIIHDADGIREVQTVAPVPPPPSSNDGEELTIFDRLWKIGNGE